MIHGHQKNIILLPLIDGILIATVLPESARQPGKQRNCNSCYATWNNFQFARAVFMRPIAKAKQISTTNRFSFLSSPDNYKASLRLVSCSPVNSVVKSHFERALNLKATRSGLQSRFQNCFTIVLVCTDQAMHYVDASPVLSLPSTHYIDCLTKWRLKHSEMPDDTTGGPEGLASSTLREDQSQGVNPVTSAIRIPTQRKTPQRLCSRLN